MLLFMLANHILVLCFQSDEFLFCLDDLVLLDDLRLLEGFLE